MEGIREPPGRGARQGGGNGRNEDSKQERIGLARQRAAERSEQAPACQGIRRHDEEARLWLDEEAVAEGGEYAVEELERPAVRREEPPGHERSEQAVVLGFLERACEGKP